MDKWWDAIKKKSIDMLDEVSNSSEILSDIRKSVSEKVGAPSDPVEKSDSSINDFLSRKTKDALASVIDFDDALEKLDTAQQMSEQDISPLVDFVKNLKSFVEEEMGTFDDFISNISAETLYKMVDKADELPVPGLDLVCKSLRLILKIIKPSLKSTNTQNFSNCSVDLASDNEQKINRMIDLVMEDGVMTLEEKEFILKKADALGLDVDMVELKIMKRSRSK